MTENTSATSRTKHADIRYHYVREFIIDGFIKIIFFKSDENKSDIFTKNVSSDIYEKHKQHYIEEKEYLNKY